MIVCRFPTRYQDNVEFIVNASHEMVLSYLARASIGLSTMVDEHFGINVVEFMVSFLCPRTDLGVDELYLRRSLNFLIILQAAGVIPVTHASGGPLNDIVVPFNGGTTGKFNTRLGFGFILIIIYPTNDRIPRNIFGDIW